MAVGLSDPPPVPLPRPADTSELFRGFQTALDPRKLLVAAVGVLAMSLGWYLLSVAFDYKKPLRDAVEYQPATVAGDYAGKKKAGDKDYTEADFNDIAQRHYDRDLAAWRVRTDLAGEDGGRLRVMPWDEYRGPNPFLLFTNLVSGNSIDIEGVARNFFAGTVPVLIEPFRKLLLPLVKLLDPNATLWTRVYLLLCLAWSVAVWAFAGGVITRLAAVGLAGKDRVTLSEAVRYVSKRYLSYVLSPLAPVGIIAFIILVMALYGLVALIPIVGDVVLYGLLWPLVLLGGIVMAVLVVGLVGYPLMYPTISAEGSDTFDALSRSYNYVFQAPWKFLWYNVVSLLYGSLVVLFVLFVASLMVYLGKFAVSQAPWSEQSGRKPDYLFVYAPEAFGWKQLLLEGSDLAVDEKKTPPRQSGEARSPVATTPVPAAATQAGSTAPPQTTAANEDILRERVRYEPADGARDKQYRDNMKSWEWLGARMVGFWLTVAMLFVIGFTYSYFWSSATIIYLLMRRVVDETEIDEVYAEEEFPEPPANPVVPPLGQPAPTGAPAGGVNLPTVPAAPTYTPPVEPLPPLPVSPPPTTYTPSVPPAGSAPVVSTPVVVPPDATTTVTAADLPALPVPPPVTTPTTEPSTFPPPTDDLKQGGEFKKDTDSL